MYRHARSHGGRLILLCLGAVAISGRCPDGSEVEPSAVDETTVSKERIEALRAQLPVLFLERTRPCTDFESVISNDGLRWANLKNACPDPRELSYVIVEFVNIPRPQEENDILVEYGEKLWNETDSKKKDLQIGDFFMKIHRFCTTDARLFDLARLTIESREFKKWLDRSWAVCPTVEFVGLIRANGVSEYLTKAARRDFWQALYAGLDINLMPNLGDIDSVRSAVISGILHLPVKESIPILEEILADEDTRKGIDRIMIYALDEAWRRKLGEPPAYTYRVRYDLRESPGMCPDPYPEWLYGSGGQKVEWPLGEAPKGHKPGPVYYHVELP